MKDQNWFIKTGYTRTKNQEDYKPNAIGRTISFRPILR